jgi:fatty-acyl-CoA synthase
VTPNPWQPARRLLGTVHGAAGAAAEALAGPISAAVGPLGAAVGTAGVLREARLIAPIRPDRLIGMALALRYGTSIAAGLSVAAARSPRHIGLIDDAGSLTYRELAERSDALAEAYALRGVRSGTAVGLLARNGRGFVEPLVALSKVGADVVLLNTGMAAPQLAEVTRRETLVAAVSDDDLADLLPAGLLRLDQEVSALGRVSPRTPPAAPGRLVLLTSGTTGTPKGAARSLKGAGPGVALLEAIPYRAGEPLLIASPMFHAWGLANLGLSLLLGSTLVVRRRFDPEQVLADIEAHAVTVMAAVPVMLQRLVELDPATRAAHDTASLRAVAISGSALPATLAERFQDTFGDVIYNLYGSTEIGTATVASPADLRADPGTAGRPLRGVTVAIVDADGGPVADGTSGRIFVGSELAFEGYTGGGDKARLRGMVSSGDTGRFDADGRLVIDGRDDDMIVSGGENVFPGEVEDVITRLDGVQEAAVVGVADERFGQALVAFVVGPGLDEDAVRSHVRSHLASYKVPRVVSFLDELPRNATGKVLKNQLVADRATG